MARGTRQSAQAELLDCLLRLLHSEGHKLSHIRDFHLALWHQDHSLRHKATTSLLFVLTSLVAGKKHAVFVVVSVYVYSCTYNVFFLPLAFLSFASSSVPLPLCVKFVDFVFPSFQKFPCFVVSIQGSTSLLLSSISRHRVNLLSGLASIVAFIYARCDIVRLRDCLCIFRASFYEINPAFIFIILVVVLNCFSNRWWVPDNVFVLSCVARTICSSAKVLASSKVSCSPCLFFCWFLYFLLQ